MFKRKSVKIILSVVVIIVLFCTIAGPIVQNNFGTK